VRELKAFRKVWLKPGESEPVRLDLPAGELSYWSAALHHRVLEPGDFDLWIGSDSDASLHQTFRVIGTGASNTSGAQ
jgi:beta-glucosidase